MNSPTLRLLVLSDLHLDHDADLIVQGGPLNQVGVDVVVLAGDIDEGLKGLRWARTAFPHTPIVYIAGNHEFYKRDWSKHVHEMRSTAQQLGIHFLEREAVEIGGVRFLGCTLWTDFEINGPGEAQACRREAQYRLNDYQQIRYSRTSEDAEFYWLKSKTIVPAITVRRHRQSVEWLEAQLEQSHPGNTVVVTHHAPHPNSIPPSYVGDPLTPAFVSDLDRLMGRSAFWIHGHVHESFDYYIRGTRVLCNPRGYSFDRPRRGENDAFSFSFIVDIIPRDVVN
ncbi:metallophosphoesterase [Xylophilus ampelinus]|uniref:Calcineurin-like phosphoesterase family protein n=2 Tax=Xylophilus ampelinus TaxID=54067 RepID=A0A318SUS8_9BURK|nr:metallophosphoesterase [Xylophilus ampelinus]PYE78457.1 calcineurin-like phosphoesterase family protein [Xylophilus ampelinus]